MAPRYDGISDADLEAFKQLDTCILSDALESFDVRLKNQGYTRPGLRCMTGNFDPIVGYAVTARVRSSEPPVLGHSYAAHHDWWHSVEAVPQPRIAAIQDIDPEPGTGACVGQVAAAIFQAMHFVGVVTNGSARDLPALTEMQLPVFARHVSPSHSYAHIVDHSQPVEICGLVIRAGDLLMADRHGVVSIPPELVHELPQLAHDLLRRKRKFAEFCRSREFSPDRLAHEVSQLKP